jgi:hypothetical protein
MRDQSVETIEHFLKLARRGRPDTGASGGELRARRLAIAILENAVGLDAQAIEGAAEFLRRAPLAISTARALINADHS